MDLVGSFRRFTKQTLGNGSRILRLTGFESLAVAQSEDDLMESARAGRRFFGGTQVIANGIAPVQAIPTTNAAIALYNGESTGGKSLIIHQISFALLSGTAAAGATLLGTVSTKPLVTAPTANTTGYASQSASGSGQATKALWGAALTLPSSPVQAWKAIQSSFQLAAANVGQGDLPTEHRGGLLVPPGGCLAMVVLSGAGTTPLYGFWVSWSEWDCELE